MSEGLTVLNANKNTVTFPSRCVYSYMQPRFKEPAAIFLLILSNNGLENIAFFSSLILINQHSDVSS